MFAALKGRLEVVRLLLEAGADKEPASKNCSRALYAVASKGHLEVVRLLLEAGADKEPDRETMVQGLLFAVVSICLLEVLRLLLEAGADKEAASENCSRSLYAVASKGLLGIPSRRPVDMCESVVPFLQTIL